MLSDFETLARGERSILKGNARVSYVVSSFQNKGREWLLNFSRDGLTGSHLTKQVVVLKCTDRRPNSVVKGVEELERQNLDSGNNVGVTGKHIILRLMRILVKASILTGPERNKYRPGDLLDVDSWRQ